MAFQCPNCQKAELNVTASLEIPPDGHNDELTLQIIRCSACGFAGLANYEESRRGSRENRHHWGYFAAADEVERLERALANCPSPKNAYCKCATHKKLGKQDTDGDWKFPAKTDKFFVLRRPPEPSEPKPPPSLWQRLRDRFF
jgi:hypothetical protein